MHNLPATFITVERVSGINEKVYVYLVDQDYAIYPFYCCGDLRASLVSVYHGWNVATGLPSVRSAYRLACYLRSIRYDIRALRIGDPAYNAALDTRVYDVIKNWV